MKGVERANSQHRPVLRGEIGSEIPNLQRQRNLSQNAFRTIALEGFPRQLSFDHADPLTKNLKVKRMGKLSSIERCQKDLRLLQQPIPGYWKMRVLYVD